VLYTVAICNNSEDEDCVSCQTVHSDAYNSSICRRCLVSRLWGARSWYAKVPLGRISLHDEKGLLLFTTVSLQKVYTGYLTPWMSSLTTCLNQIILSISNITILKQITNNMLTVNIFTNIILTINILTDNRCYERSDDWNFLDYISVWSITMCYTEGHHLAAVMCTVNRKVNFVNR